MGRPQSKYVSVDASNPQAAGQCDLCGRWFGLRTLRPQQIWAGQSLYTFNSLRCTFCWDVPNEQLRTIILPPDPPPMVNSRVPNFAYEEQTVMIAQFNGSHPQTVVYGSGPELIMSDQSGTVPLILQYLTSS